MVKVRDQHDLFVSVVVEAECSGGDEAAAERRIAFITDIPRLELDDRARSLVLRLMADGAVPRGSDADAAHVAIATVNAMDFLVTWNLKHIAGAFAMARLRASCAGAGFQMPTICTPEQFLETQRDPPDV